MMSNIKPLSRHGDTSPDRRKQKSSNWEDEITDSESEDMPSTSTKPKKKDTAEEDLYLKIIKEDGVVDDFSYKKRKSISDDSSKEAQEDSKVVITLDDKDSSEDEKVNQYLDDIERKLEENIKKKAPTRNDKDNWKVVDYFSDIICIKDDVAANKHKHIQNRNTRIDCKRKKQVMPRQNETTKRRRKNKTNISLSEGEIISDEELILSDLSLSPEAKTEPKSRKDNYADVGGKEPRSSAKQRLGPSVHNRNYRSYKMRSRSKRDDLNSSDHSPVHDVRDKKRTVEVLPESFHSRQSDHHHRSHRYLNDQSEHKDNRSLRKQSSPEPYRDRGRKRSDSSPEPYRDRKRGDSSPDSYQDHKRKRSESSPESYRERKRGNSTEPYQERKRSLEKHRSKRHSKLDTKRGGGKSRSSTDCFDEDKYYGSDKSRIRNLKKKYNEYLKYARKYKHEDEDNEHIEQFARMRSKLRGEENDEKRVTETLEPSIDYKKEEEKFLRSLETYLEIKKKQEKSMPSTMPEPVGSTTNASSSNKEYDPENMSSEEEEYVPEDFTPEDVTSGQVEEYDPCSVSNTSDTNVTYQPTKIDEYEPVALRLDEEYCPMPVQSALPLTYNPTKKFGQSFGSAKPFQQQSGSRRPVWRKSNFKQYLSVSKLHSSMKLNKTAGSVPPQKAVSKNTVFIGNTINPIALNANVNLLSSKTPSTPTTAPSIEKTKIMSKLVNEKLLEIEKKKLKLLEEINRKRLLKIKEKCDEVALKQLEKRKSDLMLELNLYKESTTSESSSRSASSKENAVMNKTNSAVQVKGGINQFSLHESNTIKIKQEKPDPKAQTTSNITTKLDALEKKKAELKLEIQKKLSKNTEIVNKEKADIKARLEELERNRASLLAEMDKRETEQTKNDVNPVVIKEEKDASKQVNTGPSKTESSPASNTLQIKEEKTGKKPLLLTSVEVPTMIVKKSVVGKSTPLINEKLSELEKEKAKLMAAIAAKTKQSTNATVNVKPEKVALNDKLQKLAKEKEQLLAKIEEKQSSGAPVLPVSSSNKNISDLITKENEVGIKKETDNIRNSGIPNVTIKQEKVDNDPKMDSVHYSQNKVKISVRQDLKADRILDKSLSAQDLDERIKNLEKKRSELLQNLVKKLPQGSIPKEAMQDLKCTSKVIDKRSSVATDDISNVSGEKRPLEKSPKAIASLANQVKFKVNQQLSEINKKMELMKKIQSKSSNSPSKVVKTESIPSVSDKTGNVSKQLMELEIAKKKLLMEIKKKTSSDKENIVEKSEVNSSDLVTQSKRDLEKDDACIHNYLENTSFTVCDDVDDAVFKVPSVPLLKKITTKPQRSIIRKKKMMKPTKVKLDKNQRRKMKAYLREKKIEMLRKYVKVNVFNALWTKDSNTSANENETTAKSTESPGTSTERTEASSESSNTNNNISEDMPEHLNRNNTSTIQNIAVDEESMDDGNDDDTIEENETSTATELNEANKELVENNEPTVGETIDEMVHGTKNSMVDDEDEILVLPAPTPKPRELITIEDEETPGLQDNNLLDDSHKEVHGHIYSVDPEIKDNDDEFITLKCITIKVEKLDDIDKQSRDSDDDIDNQSHGSDDRNDNFDSNPSKTEDVQDEETSDRDTKETENDQTSSTTDDAQTESESETQSSNNNGEHVETKSPEEHDIPIISDYCNIIVIDETTADRIDHVDEDLKQEYNALAAIEEELAKLKPNANDFVLDNVEDDVVILDGSSEGSSETVIPMDNGDFIPINMTDNGNTNSNPKLRRFEKNVKSTMHSISNSPVVSRLILNNKRKLISSQLNHNENNTKLSSNHSHLSKFKFVRSNVDQPLECLTAKTTVLPVETKRLKSKLGKMYSGGLEHPSTLKFEACRTKEKTLKTDDMASQDKTELKDRTLHGKKYRKHLSVYKFEKKTNKYKFENAKKFSVNKKSSSPNLKLTNYESTHVLNVSCKSVDEYSKSKSSVISKFKLDLKSNPKRSNLKTLPPSIRRQVESLVSISQTNLQGLNTKSNKISLSQTASQELPCSQQCFQTRTALRKCMTRSRFKLSKTSLKPAYEGNYVFDRKASILSDGFGREHILGGKTLLKTSEPVDEKMSKSKYKLWRPSPGTNTTLNWKFRTSNRTLNRTTTNRVQRPTTSPRKFQDKTTFSSKFQVTLPASMRSPLNKGVSKHLKLNRLVSKYKMVRFSNQRERNRMNLSQRVQESSCYPNRTMKVINLNGTSYKVSSRSLRRKISSSCSESKSTTPPLRRTPKVCQVRGDIFSNRHIIGRQHLTSSRLRSIAVLTSRLRKNPATLGLGTRDGNRAGSVQGPRHLDEGCQQRGELTRSCGPSSSSSKTYRNLSYISPSELLKSRRSIRHRLAHRRHLNQARATNQRVKGSRKYPSLSPSTSSTFDNSLPFDESNELCLDIRYGDSQPDPFDPSSPDKNFACPCIKSEENLEVNLQDSIGAPSSVGSRIQGYCENAGPDSGGIFRGRGFHESASVSDPSGLGLVDVGVSSRLCAENGATVPDRFHHKPTAAVPPSDCVARYFDSTKPGSTIGPEADECVETVIPRRVRKVGALPGFIPL